MTIPLTTDDEKPLSDPDAGEFAEELLDKERVLAERDRILRTGSPAEVIALVQTMNLRELYELPREIVEAWPGDAMTPGTARYVRAERLTTEWKTKATWLIRDIAVATNVTHDGVRRWRSAYNNQHPDWRKRLPRPDDSAGEIKEPGEKDHPGGRPLWYPSTILDWLRQTKRVTDDLYPHARKRGGVIPPGRPPRNATPQQRTGD